MATLLGVRIDPVTRGEAMNRIVAFLQEPKAHHVATPNPEMLVAARHDAEFKRILSATDLNIPDGAGLLFAAKTTGQHLPERVTGVDLVGDIAAYAAKNNRTIFLLGGHGNAAEIAAGKLSEKFPGLRVVGAESGGVVVPVNGRYQLDQAVLERIRMTSPEILLVAFGHGKQEKWISQHLAQFPSVRVAMGVGGTFDFYAGKVPRAPAWVRKIWFEWVWRLIQEPRRFKRIFTAAVVFPLLVIFTRNR